MRVRQGLYSRPLGRYKLWLTAEDYNGNESDTAIAYLSVENAVDAKRRRHRRRQPA